jgi:hypothetical protein
MFYLLFIHIVYSTCIYKHDTAKGIRKYEKQDQQMGRRSMNATPTRHSNTGPLAWRPVERLTSV